jgi:membrane protein insertase Oxa1/YidC/SpoIIIJ
MITKLVMILSIGLGSMGILSLLRRSESKKLDYFHKTKGFNIFLIWLILANILFYIYFILESVLYNLIIVNSDYSEIIDGSAGGYFTTEDIADKYLSLNSFLIWLFIIINIILFLSQFWLKPNPNLSSGDETNKRNYLILLLFISIITCFVSLMFLIILLNYSVSYGG